jgi:hypothetical protein
MNDPDVIGQFRATVMAQIEPWTEAHERTAVLDRLADVPYDGDVEGYIAAAASVLRTALEAAVKPRLDALRAARDANEARIEVLQERVKRQQQAFDQFVRLRVSKTKH